MDSLGRLGDQLPAELQLDKELQASFRSAALSLTGLFKVGKKATKKAYLAGKREALGDVLEFLQAGLDHPLGGMSNGTSATASPNAMGPMNIERLINYICARQETLKAEEEAEADEDNESAQPPRPAAAAAPPPASMFPARSTSSHLPARSTAAPNMLPPHVSLAHHRYGQQQADVLQAPPRARESTRHEPVASTSSSSAPTSPQHYRLASQSFSSSHIATPAHLVSSSPLASPASGVAPSPITRLQARRDKEHRDKDRKGKGSHQRERNLSSAGAEPVLVGEGIVLAVGQHKRRWTSAANTPAVVELDHDQVATGIEGNREDSQSAEGAGEDDEMMEMEGWDGVGERPLKRITRRA